MAAADPGLECEDCGEPSPRRPSGRSMRRLRCWHCNLLVCGWCWHHVHCCEPGHTRAECRDLPPEKREKHG